MADTLLLLIAHAFLAGNWIGVGLSPERCARWTVVLFVTVHTLMVLVLSVLLLGGPA